MIEFSTLGPAASFATSVMEQFKPSRAPYLLALSIGAVFIAITIDGALPNPKKMMIIFPIYFMVLILSTLSFSFRPFAESDLENNPDKIASDVDNQFKLSRITGLITGISCLYLVAYRRSEIDVIYIVLWTIIVFHCAVYLVYILFRNIKEESTQNRSFFQISVMTSLFLFLLSFSGSKITNINGSYLYGNCSESIEFSAIQKYVEVADDTPKPFDRNIERCTEDANVITKILSDEYSNIVIGDVRNQAYEISMKFMTFLFFSLLWSWFIVFWVIQIARIWRCSRLTISD